MQNTTKKEGIIYVQVPHHGDVKAYSFGSEEAFLEWLRQQAPAGFSYVRYDRQSWDKRAADDAEWKALWHDSGNLLFNSGASEIVEIWHDENTYELFPAHEAPDERDCILDAINDFHATYLVGPEKVQDVIDGKRISQHLRFQVQSAVKQAAVELGWIEPDADTANENETKAGLE